MFRDKHLTCRILFWFIQMVFTQALLNAAVFGEVPNEAIVKTSSTLCDSPKQPFLGSGLLFQHQGTFYVLTSEHVLLHTGTYGCHSVENPTFGKRAAQIAFVDWGRGIALLKVEGTFPSWISEYAALKIPNENPGAEVFSVGFPLKTSELLVSPVGKIVLEHSPRAFIPAVAEHIEVLGAHVEYGMSGGPLLGASSRNFLGVLSHQFVRIMAGKGSEVGEYSPKLEANPNHFFVIPSQHIFATLDGYFQAPLTFAPTATRIWADQWLGNSESAIVHGLKFESRTIDKNGIGGGEGVGSGGHGGVNTMSEVDFIQLSLAPSEWTTHWPQEQLQTWVSKVRQLLLSGKTIRLQSFMEFETPSGLWQKRKPIALAQAFQWLQNKRYRPIFFIVPDLKDPIQKVNENLDLLSNQLNKPLSYFLKAPPDPLSSDLLHQLEVLRDLSLAHDWELADGEWLKRLVPSHAQAPWKLLVAKDFDQAVLLMSSLKELTDFINHLRVTL